MKSLNDNLREEFREIINTPDFIQMISKSKLDSEIIKYSFEKLLSNKTGANESALIEKGRAEFEVYIINSLKSRNHKI
jgi:hypothetical protein